jgi:hypothetical protein
MDEKDTVKQSVHRNPQVAAAWIGGITALAGTIATAIITQRAPAPKPTASTDEAVDWSRLTPTDSNEIPPKAIADGRAYYVTMHSPPQDKRPLANLTANETVAESVFTDPKDSHKWVRLTIAKTPHFKTSTMTASDYKQAEGHLELNADEASNGNSDDLKTDNFTIKVEVLRSEVGEDTNPDPLAGNVFEDLYLKISAKPDEHKGKSILGIKIR